MGQGGVPAGSEPPGPVVPVLPAASLCCSAANCPPLVPWPTPRPATHWMGSMQKRAVSFLRMGSFRSASDSAMRRLSSSSKAWDTAWHPPCCCGCPCWLLAPLLLAPPSAS